jgi:AraC-like DNA-binding protein
LILSGGYEEAGDGGRWCVAPGDVLAHRPFEAHLDRVQTRGCTLLNLPLPPDAELPGGFRVSDPDEIVRLAQTDARAAMTLLLESAKEPLRARQDWPDRLAEALRSGRHFSIGTWGDAEGLNAASISRGFRQAFGVTPSRYRQEARGRRALEILNGHQHSLSSASYACGFADQSHMTRVVRHITGVPPGRWVRDVKRVQDT